jgi:copper chaperone CopZ
MKRAHYNVTGLVNEQMKNEIKNALDKVDGVQIVNIDLGRSTIEVGYNESIDEDSIKESIEHAGCIIK